MDFSISIQELPVFSDGDHLLRCGGPFSSSRVWPLTFIFHTEKYIKNWTTSKFVSTRCHRHVLMLRRALCRVGYQNNINGSNQAETKREYSQNMQLVSCSLCRSLLTAEGNTEYREVKMWKAKPSEVWLHFIRKDAQMNTCNKCLKTFSCKCGKTSDLMKHMESKGQSLNRY